MMKPHLLLIDDDKEEKEILLEIGGFEKKFHVMGMAANFDELLILTKERIPDIILSDWYLGNEFASTILHNYFTLHKIKVPVVIMSSLSTLPDNEMKLLEDMGITRVMQKPFDYLVCQQLSDQVLEYYHQHITA